MRGDAVVILVAKLPSDGNVMTNGDGMMRGSVVVEVVKAVIWPGVVLIVVGLFYAPLHDMIDILSRRSADIQSLKLGQLELNIRVSDLPVPSRETAVAIASFDARMLIELLGLQESGGPCFPDQDFRNTAKYIALSKLAKLDQIKLVAERGTTDICMNPHSVTLTETGKQTREFVLNLVTSQVRGSRTQG